MVCLSPFFVLLTYNLDSSYAYSGSIHPGKYLSGFDSGLGLPVTQPSAISVSISCSDSESGTPPKPALGPPGSIINFRTNSWASPSSWTSVFNAES